MRVDENDIKSINWCIHREEEKILDCEQRNLPIVINDFNSLSKPYFNWAWQMHSISVPHGTQGFVWWVYPPFFWIALFPLLLRRGVKSSLMNVLRWLSMVRSVFFFRIISILVSRRTHLTMMGRSCIERDLCGRWLTQMSCSSMYPAYFIMFLWNAGSTYCAYWKKKRDGTSGLKYNCSHSRLGVSTCAIFTP